MKLTLIALYLGTLCAAFGNACTSAGGSTTASNLASTWTSCGASSSIAFDAAGPATLSQGYSAGGTVTYSHTIGSGSNRILWVFVQSYQPTGADGVTAVTYGGNALAQEKKVSSGGYSGWEYAYCLVAPTTGAANVVVSSTTQMVVSSVSYSGASQTCTPDGSGSTTGVNLAPSVSLTTAMNGDWLVGVFGSSDNIMAAAGINRQGDEFAIGQVIDTNAPVATGSVSLTVINGGSVDADGIVIGMAPSSFTAGTTPQPTDVVTIATPVVLKASLSVISVAVNGATADLQTDGLAAYTVTTSGGLIVSLGCTASGGGCPSAYAIDTSAASAGNEVTFVDTGITSTGYVITSTPTNASISLNLAHVIIQAGIGQGINFGGGNTSYVKIFNMTNSEIVNGVEGVDFTINSDTTTFNVNIQNLSSTGLSTGHVVNFVTSVPQACTLQNITEMTATSNVAMLQSGADTSVCVITGNVVVGDAAGVYYPQAVSMGEVTPSHTSTWSYNFAKSYHVTPLETEAAFTACIGTASFPCIWSNNISDGVTWGFILPAYGQSSGNICFSIQSCNNDLNAHATSTNDIIYVPQGLLGLFDDGITTDGDLLINNITIVSPNPGAPCTCGGLMQFGDVDTMTQITNSGLFNSILYGGNYGIISENTANAFLTSGMGGVGVAGNDVYGAAQSSYLKVGTSTNFDNGATAHPSVATYADMTINPGFVTLNRRWANCDAMFGGPGTDADLFTQLFNRWNGSNVPLFNVQSIYNCMHAGFAPTNMALVGKGAVTPVLIFTGVQ